MSAISDAGGAFFQNARETKDYEERLDAGQLPIVRGLERSAEDDLRRAVIQSLMCRMKLDLDQLEETFGRDDLAEYFAAEWQELQPLADEGFCTLADRRVLVQPRGRLFLRHMAMVFDAYLCDEKPDGPRFSQTV